MTNQPWFRFYSEALNDRKLARIARLTNTPRMMIMGIWSSLLCLANDSPIRGELLISESLPWTIADLAQEFDCEESLLNVIIEQALLLEMLQQTDGVISICHWAGRQFESDHSTSRVQQYREKRRAAQDVETFQKRCAPVTCNVSETYQSRAEQNRTEAEQSRNVPPPPAAALADAVALWENMTARPITPMEAENLSQALADYGEVRLRWAIGEASAHNARAWAYVRRVLDGNGQPSARASPDRAGPDRASPSEPSKPREPLPWRSSLTEEYFDGQHLHRSAPSVTPQSGSGAGGDSQRPD